MKKLLLSLTMVFSLGLLMAQDCVTFEQYYDALLAEAGLTGFVEGTDDPNYDPATIFLVPPQSGTSFIAGPQGDTIVCAGNVVNMGPGPDWVPTVSLVDAMNSVDTFLHARASYFFGRQGSWGGIDGSAASWPIGIFLDDLEGCLDPVIVPYPDMYFAGQVALVQRGACAFSDKTQRVQEADGEGILIFNSAANPGFQLVNMSAGADQGLTIPAWFLSLEQGLAIVEQIDLEENPVEARFEDVFMSAASWTKNGAAFSNDLEVCSDTDGGEYSIETYSVNGCGSWSFTGDSVNVLIGPAPCGGQAACTVGIADDVLNEKVSIYPNPTTGLVSLNIGDAVETEISVYTITGQKVINETSYNQETIPVDLSKLDSGIYLVKIKQGSAIATKRVNVLK